MKIFNYKKKILNFCFVLIIIKFNFSEEGMKINLIIFVILIIIFKKLFKFGLYFFIIWFLK
jgi:hypothetical protein